MNSVAVHYQELVQCLRQCVVGKFCVSLYFGSILLWLSKGSGMMFILKLKAEVLNNTMWTVGWKRKMGH